MRITRSQLSSGAFDLRDGLTAPVFVEVAEDEPGSLLGEANGSGPTEPELPPVMIAILPPSRIPPPSGRPP
ncbi:MAG: hypothetical protein ABIQ73_03455 [Acidimicrobiales bacterium]